MCLTISALKIHGNLFSFKVMREFGVYNIVFSSSATVYGVPQYLPLDEKHPAGQCTSPYGRTKYFIEQILTDIATSDEVCLQFSLDALAGVCCYLKNL